MKNQSIICEWTPFIKESTPHGCVYDLPLDGQEILVSYDNYVIADTFIGPEDDFAPLGLLTRGDIEGNCELTTAKPIAWMALPDPYKKGV